MVDYIEPLNDFVIFQKDDVPEDDKKTIILVSQTDLNTIFGYGKVLGSGPYVKNIKLGDNIYYLKEMASELIHKSEKYYVIKAEFIIATVESVKNNKKVN